MLSESLKQFEFDLTRFQQAFNIFYAFNNVERPVKNAPDIWFNIQQSVERLLKQVLKRQIYTLFVTVLVVEMENRRKCTGEAIPVRYITSGRGSCFLV